MTQEQLADVAGVTKNTVSSIERGQSDNAPRSVAAVRDALGIEPLIQAMQNDTPDDVALVAQMVAMWLQNFPAGEERAAAVLRLVQYLATPQINGQ